MDKFLENYINQLYWRQNIGANPEQRDLFKRDDYYLILKPVIEVLMNNKDADLTELRNILYEQSGIEKNLRDYVLQKKTVPGLVVSYGTKNFKETIVVGNQEEIKVSNGKIIPSIKEMHEDTIFDLASVTKIFTSLSIMKLLQNGLINLDDEIVKYDERFKNLKGVTIYDLLCFNVPLKTNRRIDSVDNNQEAEEILFNIEINHDDDNRHPYTDMGVMILRYVIEKVTGLSYYEFLDKTLLKKFLMNDTYFQVPNYKLERVASNNFDSKVISDGSIITNTKNYPGIVYDRKAQIMGQEVGQLTGHAGLFSSASDMTILMKNIIDGEVLADDLLTEMAKNRQGRSYLDENGFKNYVQYFGYMTYSKHPIKEYSEVFHALSGKSFAGAGWTGTQMTVDPINELYFFLGSNRAHNRVTALAPNQKDKLITIDGRQGIVMPDGSFKINSKDFAMQRCDVIERPLNKLLLQYKMLEDMFLLQNEKTETMTRVVK